jgi:hypothetical protein
MQDEAEPPKSEDPDDAEWREGAFLQFIRDDSPGDAIYDAHDLIMPPPSPEHAEVILKNLRSSALICG